MPSLILPFPAATSIDLVALFYICAASWVTAHALFQKRDVRAAVGWIALAWLSPILGPVAYWFLGINRITRRAARLTRDMPAPRPGREASAARPIPALQRLAAVGDRLTGLPVQGGNRVSVLRSGDEAFAAMIAAIGQARHSVGLGTYIFRYDSVGQRVIAALAGAQARGVAVRVLIDGIGGGYLFAPAVRALEAAGIPTARFLHSWLPWRMAYLNLRSHKKLLVIDGAAAFTGSLNIDGRTAGPHPLERDIHFQVAGPVVEQMVGSFAEDWTFTTGEELTGPQWWPQNGPVGEIHARGITTGPDGDIPILETLLATAILEAERRVRIVTPYFLPDQNLFSALALAALKGVVVEILIPRRSDHLAIDWAVRGQLAASTPWNFVVRQVPAPFTHVKLMTVDGQWSLLGSGNWDVRSLRLNFEFNLECYGSALAEDLDAVIDRLAAESMPYEGERIWAARLRNAVCRLLLPYL